MTIINEYFSSKLYIKPNFTFYVFFRAVANAVRNRWRRHRISMDKLKEHIIPKNILMVGPTGVGKTEIARRLAKIMNAPFVKVVELVIERVL